MPTTTTSRTQTAAQKDAARKAKAAADKKKRDAAAKKKADAAKAKSNGATKPATPATPERTPITTAQAMTFVRDFANEHGSTDPFAPEKGLPFVHSDKLYLQLEGRVAGGLLEFVRAEDSAVGKNELRQAIIDGGFSRRPFSYHHSERGQTSASHYSVPTSKVTGLKLGARQQAERKNSRAATATAMRETVDLRSIPMKFDGATDEEKAKLDALRKAHTDAQAAWRAHTGDKPADGATKEQKAQVAEQNKAAKAELKAATETAKNEWVEFRQTLAAKYAAKGS